MLALELALADLNRGPVGLLLLLNCSLSLSLGLRCWYFGCHMPVAVVVIYILLVNAAV